MHDELKPHVPTDQDLRNIALQIAERLVTVKMQNGGIGSVSDPIALTITYADAVFKYIKEGQTNG